MEFEKETTYIHEKKPSKKGGRRFIATVLVAALVGGAAGVGTASLYFLRYGALDGNTATPQVIRVDSEGRMDIPSIAQEVSPKIVGIATYVSTGSGALETPFGTLIPRKENSLSPYGWGSGVVIKEDGIILTNDHVIAKAEKIVISTSDGKEYDAKVLGTDPTSDLAVLQAEGLKMEPVAIGSSRDLRVGEDVVAIGNPLAAQFSQTVTDGIVSGINRELKMDNHIFELIQTNCAINSGNSGGALVNRKGELVGINSSKISATGVEGIGFAIPIDGAMTIAEDLIANGKIERPTLGIRGYNMTEDIAARLGFADTKQKGVLIARTDEGSGAEAAGLKAYDVIIGADDKKVSDFADLSSVINTKKKGDTITLTYLREGKEEKAEVTLK